MKYTGRVTKELFGVGSKSEHEAVMIETAEGKFKLAYEGCNAFNDAKLNKLVGKTIECEGKIFNYSLIMETWEPVSEIKQMWDLLTKSNAEIMQFKMFTNKGDKKPFRMIVFIEGEAAVEEVNKFLDSREAGERASFRADVPE